MLGNVKLKQNIRTKSLYKNVLVSEKQNIFFFFLHEKNKIQGLMQFTNTLNCILSLASVSWMTVGLPPRVLRDSHELTSFSLF